jgi:hypothetical protein
MSGAGPCATDGSSDRAAERWSPRPSSDVLFASRDGGRAIRNSQGHQDLTATQRQMYFSPAAIEGTIRLRDQRCALPHRGDFVKTIPTVAENVR